VTPARALRTAGPVAVVVVFALLAAAPQVIDAYQTSFLINLLGYVVMSTAWAIFSGNTKYISLATAAFFGVGAYTVAFIGDALPMPVIIVIAAVVGFLFALVVGLSTLRLRGVYFVVFTFGLTELTRQLVHWWEINETNNLVRLLFLDVTSTDLYYYLIVLTALTFLTAWLIKRSRVGLALRVIGEDESVANHTGINATRIKVLTFALSAGLISATGAILVPRWTNVEPNIAFNSLISFQVLVMALLGGTGTLFGPALGAIPLVFLSEYLSGTFPYQFNIALGLCFVAIVYLLPQGVAGALTDAWRRFEARRADGRAPA
jgi:branched-chain amino acid transport system permease protein